MLPGRVGRARPTNGVPMLRCVFQGTITHHVRGYTDLMHEAITTTLGSLLSAGLIMGMAWDWWRHPTL
jgi:hypothetical protein